MEFGSISNPEGFAEGDKDNKKEERAKKKSGELFAIPREERAGTAGSETHERFLEKILKERQSVKDPEATLGSSELDNSDPERGKQDLEHLTEEERPYVVNQYVEARLNRLEQDQAQVEPGSVEDVEVIADQLFMENLRDKLAETEGEDVETIIEEAGEQTESELRALASEDEVPLQEQASHDSSFEQEGDLTSEEGEIPLARIEPPVVVSGPRAVEAAPEEDSGGQAGGSGAPPPPSGGGSSGGFSGGVVPPVGGGPARAAGVQPAMSNYNMAPASPANTETLIYHDRSGEFGALLLGGILGYLIGRRRGRIKTEKKLKPIQRKLEKEVRNLHGRIAQQEQRIRKVAAEKSRQEDIVEKIKLQKEKQVGKHTEFANAAKVETATKKEGGRRGVESVGRAVVAAESSYGRRKIESGPADIGRHEVGMQRSERTTEAKRPSLSHAELLDRSRAVVVGGHNLRELYENHALTERGLRHVMEDYLEGKDAGRTLQRELAERQKDYERDPLMRDRDRISSEGSRSGSALNELLEKAGATATSKEELEHVQQAQAAARKLQKHAERRIYADIAMVSAIAVLTAIVLVLWLAR